MDDSNSKKTEPAISRLLLHVVVKDKKGVIVEEDVKAVSSYNEVGLFDVLAMHTNFISLIRKKLIIHRPQGDKEIKIGTGLMKVDENNVQIYLGLPEEDMFQKKN